MTDQKTLAELNAQLAALEHRSSAAKIDLGLSRVEAVFKRLFPVHPWAESLVITAAGTNGKGSTLAFAEAICLASRRSVVVYSSPHIDQFTERLRFNGAQSSPEQWLEAFQSLDEVAQDQALTYFEYITLAAFIIIDKLGPDVVLLEVGLGGRLDAVNVVEPDVAILTNIGLDHQAYLGPTRVHIGREKLGIARKQKPLILAERDFPEGLEAHLAELDARLFRVGEAFDWRQEPDAGPDPQAWSLTLRGSVGTSRLILPPPGLYGEHQMANAAAAIMALVAAWGEGFAKTPAVVEGIEAARLEGRFEVLQSTPEVIGDVAHNRESCLALAQMLKDSPVRGRTFAVFSALNDKPIETMAQALKHVFDHWWVAGLDGPRGHTGQEVKARLAQGGITQGLDTVKSIPEALDQALACAKANDRVVVFGSFHVLAEARSRWINKE